MDDAPEPEHDLIARVRRDVATFDAQTPRERDSRDRFLAELDRLPHPFSEDADPVHITGSAIVVGSPGVVLHFHKRLAIWLQPGGHIDPREAPWRAALRESREETGLPVDHPPGGPQLVHVDVHPAARGHTHLDLRYLLHSTDAEPAPPPGESQQVRWFAWHDAVAIADPGLIDALRRLRPR